MAKYFLLLIGLFLVLGAAAAYKASKQPPGKGRPRPNRKRRNKFIHSFFPITAAIFISIMAWVGLSLLFSSDHTDQAAASKSVTGPVPEPIQNKVTQNVETDLLNGSIAPIRNQPLVQIGGSGELGPSAEPMEGFPSPLTQLPDSTTVAAPKASSPQKPSLSQAAQWASPQDSPMEKIGLGQNLIKTEAEPEDERAIIPNEIPPTIRPRTVAHPRREPAITELFPELKPQADPLTASRNPGITGDSFYTVLLASFGLKGNAERNLARLRAAGVPVFISMAEIDHRSYYRLMAGRFPTRTEAVQYGRKLERNGLTRETGRHMIKSLYDDAKF